MQCLHACVALQTSALNQQKGGVGCVASRKVCCCCVGSAGGGALPAEEALPLLALLADVQLREDAAALEAKLGARLTAAAAAAGGDLSKVCGAQVRGGG